MKSSNQTRELAACSVVPHLSACPLIGVYINLNININIYIYIRGLSTKFGEWYQKTNKTEGTNKLNLLVFKTVQPPYSPDLVSAGARSGEYGGIICFPA
jgi:hypothetical protein